MTSQTKMINIHWTTTYYSNKGLGNNRLITRQAFDGNDIPPGREGVRRVVNNGRMLARSKYRQPYRGERGKGVSNWKYCQTFNYRAFFTPINATGV